MNYLNEFFPPKLLFGMFCILLSAFSGYVLGYQRGKVGHSEVGERTMSLVSIGACLFTMIPMLSGFESEVWRIAANVVTGIGFIGAGVLLKDGTSIKGLTTATTIWISSALGVAYGSCNQNNIILGLFVTVLTYFILAKKKKTNV